MLTISQATGVLADRGFSAAIFAPAWTFEHFLTLPSEVDLDLEEPLSMAKAVDRSMWEGFSLPAILHCDCLQGKPHENDCYRVSPIIDNATEHPAGSSSYLHSDFARAFRQNGGEFKSYLGAQAILPHLLPTSAHGR